MPVPLALPAVAARLVRPAQETLEARMARDTRPTDFTALENHSPELKILF